MPYDYPSPKQTGGDPFTREVYVTTNGSKRRKSKDNPLLALKPLVVVATDNYAARVVLGVDAVTRDQRDVALKYLNELIGGNSPGSEFKLEETTAGQAYSLRGCTGSVYTRSDEFRGVVAESICPRFNHVGELKVAIVRANTRHMVGVECTLTATDRGLNQVIPALDEDPPEVIGLVNNGATVIFSLKNLVREVGGKPQMATDADLIGDALKVAERLGIYVERPPAKVTDPDERARLYPRFNLPEVGGEG